jgi:hypothetical protein
VIVHDGVLMPWENALDLTLFTVRVLEADIPHLERILSAISDEQVHRMQARLAQVGISDF